MFRPISAPRLVSGLKLETAMPAIISLTISTAAPVVRALSALAGRLGRSLKRAAERVKNRRDAMRLADLDDRMLADIGISRSDLRDAYSGPLWRDPSELLARRATERRVRRRRGELTCGAQTRRQTALFGAPPVLCYPPTGGQARHSV
jgi:uncharacterized protein YjiS (DUF1127 family)